MEPTDDRPTPELPSESAEEALERMHRERERLAEERRAVRLERRRREKQFLGLVLICIVLFFSIGVVLGRAMWGREATSAPDHPASGAADQPPPVESARNTPPTTAEDSDPSSTSQSGYNVADRAPIPIEDEDTFVSYMKQWRGEDPKFLHWRWDRYQKALQLGDLTHRRVKEAFLATPREKFCRPWNLDQAYDHAYLDIHYGVTISGPHIVCRMTNALNPQPEHRCLEIGTGSGYQAAMLANLSNHVYSIEIIEPLLKETEEIFAKLVQEGYDEYTNVHLKAADGYYGWPEYAPFDRIIVTCGIDHIPPPLLQQLGPNGVMVIPIGTPNSQKVLKVTKKIKDNGEVQLLREDLYPGRTRPIQFVPFTAEGGGTHYR